MGCALPLLMTEQGAGMIPAGTATVYGRPREEYKFNEKLSP